MKKIYFGLENQIVLPKGSFLYIGDIIPKHAKAKIFDPFEDCFNPLRKGIEKKEARELARALYTASPQGENTLTFRNGRRALARALADGKRFDKLEVHSNIKGVKEEVEGMIEELLFTDLMRRVLCTDDDFAFTGRNTKVFARVNRAELGEEDALALTFLLIANYKGQLVIPDFGFCGRDCHASLINEGRLIAGVKTLAELSPKLRQAVLSIEEKVARRVTFEDAQTLANYMCKHPPPTDGYDTFIKGAMA